MTMKILRLAKDSGCPSGIQQQLNLLVDGVDLEEEKYILSLRDEMRVSNLPKGAKTNDLGAFAKSFALSQAKALVTEGTNDSGYRIVRVTIESPNTCDFAALYQHVYRIWLGIPHEDIPLPKYRLQEPSFIRGIHNDLRDLWQFLKNCWRRAQWGCS